MMGGMVVGGLGKSLLDSTKGVDDSCKAFAAAQERLRKSQAEWQKDFKEASIAKSRILTLEQDMAAATNSLQIATKNYHNKFKQRQFMIDAAIVVFLLSILISLILKRIDLWGKIKSLF